MACPDPDVLARFAQGLLRDDELERFEAHLSACGDCLREVGALASRDDAEEIGHPGAELGLLRRGATIGRYLVLDLLGSGGMGLVYNGYDPLLDRKVALKLLRPVAGELESAPGPSRLLREAQALARVSHPNVVAIYDVGSVGEQVFLALERVEGVSLSAWLRQPRRWQQIRDAFVEAGRGLAAAHAAGIVHRDFKPDNVLVGADARVRVTDFGLARAQREPEGPLTPAAPLVPAGTPGFIAPEVLAGHAADARSDQFSFCVALEQALSSGARLGRVPQWLRRAILRGRGDDPAARFSDLDALLDALTSDPWRRVLPLAIGAAVIALLAGAWVATRHEPAAPPCRDAASRLAPAWNDERAAAAKRSFEATHRPYAGSAWAATEATLASYSKAWVAMRTDACEATQVRQEQSGEALDLRMACLDRRAAELTQLADLLEHADEKVVENAPVAAERLGEISACADVEGLRRTQRAPADATSRARLEALRSTLATARALSALGKPKEAQQLAAPLQTEARALAYHPAEAEVSFVLGDAAAEAGDYAAATGPLHEAAIAAEAGADLLLEAHAYARLAMVTGPVQRQLEQGDLFARHARMLLERIGHDSELEADVLDVESQLHYLGGHLDASLDESKQAIASLERAGKGSDRRAAALRSFAGFVLADLGRLDEAVRYEERALADRQRALGEQHPEMARSLTNLALVHTRLGADEEALAEFLRARDIWTAAFGASHPPVGFANQCAAEALLQLGRLDEAERTGQLALTTLKTGYGPNHPRVGSALATLGRIALARGALDEAQTRYEQALAIFRAPGSNPARQGLPLAGLGEVLLARHRAKDALEPLEHAVESFDQLEGTDDEHAEANFALARALWDSGGDRGRSLTLASRAKDQVARLPAQRSPRREIDAWLAAHAASGSTP